MSPERPMDTVRCLSVSFVFPRRRAQDFDGKWSAPELPMSPAMAFSALGGGKAPDAEVKAWTDEGWTDAEGPSVRGPESVDIPGESGIIDKPDGVTALSPIFMSHTDQSFINMKDVKPIEGYEDVAIHGSPYYAFGYGMDGLGEIKYTAQDLADMLVESGTWHGGDIRLLSCEAGARADGLAQQLADILGVRVMAPDKVLYTVPGFGGETRFYIGSRKGMADGNWVTFKPQEVK